MNRKQLTATQILHGARAYSHNASRRAHQLSGPKRVRVMHGPVGSHFANAASQSTDECCSDCGHFMCSCDHDAPQVNPKPSARALDNLGGEPSPAGGRTFKTGDRVRGIGCSSGDWREGVVLERYSGSAEYTDGLTPLLADDGSRPFVLTITIEPAPSPVSEAPAVESDEAVLKRCGWREARRGRVWMTGCFEHSSTASVWQTTGDTAWRWAPDDEAQRGMAPTLLQAACAALGITVHECSSGWAAHRNGDLLAVKMTNAESCAHAALEAWSRRHG